MPLEAVLDDGDKGPRAGDLRREREPVLAGGWSAPRTGPLVLPALVAVTPGTNHGSQSQDTAQSHQAAR